VSRAATQPVGGRWQVSSTAAIALGITLVIVVATAIVLLAGGQAGTSYPANSPEGAFQRYLDAWFDKDYAAAYEYFTPRIKATMSYDEFERDAELYGSYVRQTVSLDRSSGTDPTRTLHLTVTDYYGDPAYGGGYSQEQSVRMRLEGTSWLIDEALIGLQPYYDYGYP
jgi:hypothetical protein